MRIAGSCTYFVAGGNHREQQLIKGGLAGLTERKRKMSSIRRSIAYLILVAFAVGSASPVLAQQTTGTPGSPGATTTIDGKQLPPPASKFGGVIKEKASESQALVGAARRAAEGRAQRAAHHDGRPGFRRTEHFRRRHSHTGHGSHREGRAALHEFPLHVAVLTDAGGIDYGPQPSLGGLRGGRRNSDGVPGLRLDHPD